MRKYVLTTLAMLLTLSCCVAAQSRKRPATRIVKGSASPAKTPPAPAPYEITAVLLKGQGVFIMNIEPTRDYPGTAQTSFQSFLNDYFGGTRPGAAITKRPYSKVILKFGEDDDVATIIDGIKAVRVSDKVVVEIQSLLDSSRIVVPPIVKTPLIVRPNPLTLVVAMDEKGHLTLNNDDMGNISDPSRLTATLKDVFRAREENGVFRENSNEIEKTVFIKMPLAASAADLVKISKALLEGGADPIGIQVEDLADVRKELVPDLTKPMR